MNLDLLIFNVSNLDDLLEACKYQNSTIVIEEDLISEDKFINVNLSSNSQLTARTPRKLTNINLFINNKKYIKIDNIIFTSTLNLKSNVINLQSRVNIKDSEYIYLDKLMFVDTCQRNKSEDIYLDNKLNDINIISSDRVNLTQITFDSSNCIHCNSVNKVNLDNLEFNNSRYCITLVNTNLEINESDNIEFINCDKIINNK